MTPKLTAPMITALTDAYRNGVSRIDGTSYVLRGVKTNTAEALRRRGLVTDRTVGAFGQYVLTSDGAEAAQAILATVAAEDAAAAEASLTAHMANATSNDINRAGGPIYQASRATLLDSIRTAYPDVDAQTIYLYCVDNGESVAHNVEYWRAELQAMKEEEAAAAAEDVEDDDTPAPMAYLFDVTFADQPHTASLPVWAGDEVEARRTVREYFIDGAWGTLATVTLTHRAPLVHFLDITPGMVIITDAGHRVEVAEVILGTFGIYLTPLTGQAVYLSTGTTCAQIGSFNLG